MPERLRTGAIAVVMILTMAGCAGGDRDDAAGTGQLGDAAADVRPPDEFPAPIPDLALSDLTFQVDGETTDVASSGVKIHRRSVSSYDDPATPDHDGVSESIRRFLACKAYVWSIGSQTFTVDVIADGLHEDDPSLVERGALGVDFSIEIPLAENGVHSLRPGCRDAAVEDYGGTHHSTQWLVELGRAAHLLAAVDEEAHLDRIERYVQRAEEIATTLADPDNTTHWEREWLVDSEGNIYTHKTYMRAAALQLAASLTDDADRSDEWALEAARVARIGLEAQRGDGVNPETGGHDVSYQMYGTWLAQIYASLLPVSSPLRADVEAMIERSIAWQADRTDPVIGLVDVEGSTRTCTSADAPQPYEVAVQVRVFLAQAAAHGNRKDLIDLAGRVDDAATEIGYRCD